MRKIGITGTKRDIGAALAESFVHSDEIIPFNFPEYDLLNKSHRDTIINKISELEIDIFINNSYADGGQILLLYDLIRYLQSSNSELKCITLNSVNSTRAFDKIQRLDQLKYTIDKSNIDRIHEYYNNLNLINIHLPMIDTSYNKNKLTHKEPLTTVISKIKDYID